MPLAEQHHIGRRKFLRLAAAGATAAVLGACSPEASQEDKKELAGNALQAQIEATRSTFKPLIQAFVNEDIMASQVGRALKAAYPETVGQDASLIHLGIISPEKVYPNSFVRPELLPDLWQTIILSKGNQRRFNRYALVERTTVDGTKETDLILIPTRISQKSNKEQLPVRIHPYSNLLFAALSASLDQERVYGYPGMGTRDRFVDFASHLARTEKKLDPPSPAQAMHDTVNEVKKALVPASGRGGPKISLRDDVFVTPEGDPQYCIEIDTDSTDVIGLFKDAKRIADKNGLKYPTRECLRRAAYGDPGTPLSPANNPNTISTLRDIVYIYHDAGRAILNTQDVFPFNITPLPEKA